MCAWGKVQWLAVMETDSRGLRVEREGAGGWRRREVRTCEDDGDGHDVELVGINSRTKHERSTPTLPHLPPFFHPVPIFLFFLFFLFSLFFPLIIFLRVCSSISFSFCLPPSSSSLSFCCCCCCCPQLSAEAPLLFLFLFLFAVVSLCASRATSLLYIMSMRIAVALSVAVWLLSVVREGPFVVLEQLELSPSDHAPRTTPTHHAPSLHTAVVGVGVGRCCRRRHHYHRNTPRSQLFSILRSRK